MERDAGHRHQSPSFEDLSSVTKKDIMKKIMIGNHKGRGKFTGLKIFFIGFGFGWGD